jgi:hypothetical protein
VIVGAQLVIVRTTVCKIVRVVEALEPPLPAELPATATPVLIEILADAEVGIVRVVEALEPPLPAELPATATPVLIGILTDAEVGLATTLLEALPAETSEDVVFIWRR